MPDARTSKTNYSSSNIGREGSTSRDAEASRSGGCWPVRPAEDALVSIENAEVIPYYMLRISYEIFVSVPAFPEVLW